MNNINDKANGIIINGARTDYLFRLATKGLIVNDDGKVLVVKEHGRDWWDLPGGGMEHGESIKEALARELYEEVMLQGDFSYQVLLVEEPQLLKSELNLWQVRMMFVVKPQNMKFSPGPDGDEVVFMEPEFFKGSKLRTDKEIYKYWQAAKEQKLI